MPFLARLVIAAAMLTSGWVNCFGQIEISHSMAVGLASMEIKVFSPVAETDVPEEDSAAIDSPQMSGDTTRGVHRIVWLLHEKWPTLGGWGTFIAWAASAIQLAAGVLLLVGLFTRFAALAICVATGMAIFLVSGGLHGMFMMNPFDWPHDSHRFSQLFAGLGLFTLSLGLLVSGGGGLSIDARQKKTEPLQK
jgi:uncharacterized membrane protein YphA (DoxX/SURF4 family)